MNIHQAVRVTIYRLCSAPRDQDLRERPSQNQSTDGVEGAPTSREEIDALNGLAGGRYVPVHIVIVIVVGS